MCLTTIYQSHVFHKKKIKKKLILNDKKMSECC